MTASDERITSPLGETVDVQKRKQIATLANEFWQRWTIRRGLVPSERELATSKRISAEPSIDGDGTVRSEAAMAGHGGASSRG